jgi:hypothetical protein
MAGGAWLAAEDRARYILMGAFVASLAGFSRQLGKIVDSLNIWHLRATTRLWGVTFETGYPFMLAGDGIASMQIMVELN